MALGYKSDCVPLGSCWIVHQKFRIKFETVSEASARESNRAAEPQLAAYVDDIRKLFGEAKVVYLGPRRLDPIRQVAAPEPEEPC